MTRISGWVEALHTYGIKLRLGPAVPSIWLNYSKYGYSGPAPQIGHLITVTYVGQLNKHFLRTLHDHDAT